MTGLRGRILTLAEDWIDTPYQHQVSVKGEGTDCLGLIRGIWREIYGSEPTTIPPYTPDWADSREETLLEACCKFLDPIGRTDVQPGDILLFRMAPGASCKHLAILADHSTIIHAYWGRSVVRSAFIPYWTRRHTHSFAFPDSQDLS